MMLYALIVCLGAYLVINLGINVLWEGMKMSEPLVKKKVKISMPLIVALLVFFVAVFLMIKKII